MLKNQLDHDILWLAQGIIANHRILARVVLTQVFGAGRLWVAKDLEDFLIIMKRKLE